MTERKQGTITERIMALLQEVENEHGEGDLVTGFVLVAKKTPAEHPDATRWLHFWQGSIDERFGMYRFGMRRADLQMADMHEQGW